MACGLTEQALRVRLRPGGPWQALMPGVYSVKTGTPTRDERHMAELLYALYNPWLYAGEEFIARPDA